MRIIPSTVRRWSPSDSAARTFDRSACLRPPSVASSITSSINCIAA
jgi:hypothetical protein